MSRESSLVLNNLLLTASCGIVLVGTLYPLALEAVTGDKISVGAPFFNSTVVWLFMPLLLAVCFGIFLAWKRGDLREAGHRLWPAALAGLLAGLAAAIVGKAGIKIDIAIALGTWVLVGSVWEAAVAREIPVRAFVRNRAPALSMRRSQFAATLGHIGLAVGVIGVAGASAWNSERLTILKPGESADIAGYTITFKEVFERQGPNYMELAGAFDLRSSGGGLISSIIASKRKYEAPPQATKQAGIAVRPGGDVYVVLGDETEGGAYQIKMYYHPFVRWIWGGAAIMFAAGLLSLLDRRLRIGLPQGARKPSLKSAPAPAE